MKKLLVILALVSVAALGYGQYEDALPIKPTSLSTDTIRVVKDGESGIMKRSVLLQDINDDLDTHEADGTNPHLVTAGQIGLGSVENTAISTWPGSTYITSLGTILTGVWNGTALTNAYIPTALTGKTYNGVTLTATGSATTYLNGAGGYTTPAGSGSGTPAGSTGEIQYNTSGAFDASSSFIWHDDTTRLEIGADFVSNQANPAIEISKDVVGSWNGHGVSDASHVNLEDGYAYASFDNRITLSGTSDMWHMNGFQAAPTFSSTGTLDITAALSYAPTVTAGVITEMRGINLNNPSVSGGAITTYYGFYAANTINAATTNWFMYNGGTTESYLGGDLGVKNTSPAYEIDVVGDINVTGNFLINGSPVGAGTGGYWNDTVSDIYYTTGYIGVGVIVPDAPIHSRRYNASPSSDWQYAAMLLEHETGTPMVDETGVAVDFAVRDDDAVTNKIARIGAFRSGADNSGTFFVGTSDSVAGGVGDPKFTVDNLGWAGLNTGYDTPLGALEIVSTTGALVVPRMTTTQRLALDLVNGSEVYDVTLGSFYQYQDDAWVKGGISQDMIDSLAWVYNQVITQSGDGYTKAYLGTEYVDSEYEAYMISDDYYYNNRWSKIGLNPDTAFINFGYGTTDYEFAMTDGKMFADIGTAVTSSTLYYNTTTEEITYGVAPVSADTVSISDISHMLVDTYHFVFPAKGTLVAGDIINVFEQVQDSIVFDSITVECVGTSADITLQVQYGPTWTASGTGIHTALQVTTGTEASTTTFSTPIVGPGNDIWCEPTIVATSPTMVILKLFYHEKRVD